MVNSITGNRLYNCINNNNHIKNEPSNRSLSESDSEIREYLQTILDKAKSYVQNLVTNSGENSSYIKHIML